MFEYEGEIYEIRVLDVRLFPQGYSVVAMHPEIIRDEPSVLLVDIGGWTIDIMRLDNGVPNAATCRSLEMESSVVKTRFWNKSAEILVCRSQKYRWNVF